MREGGDGEVRTSSVVISSVSASSSDCECGYGWLSAGMVVCSCDIVRVL